jgi:aryl-alcohol dehydrogenase-like predicted oxidoreductase
MNRLALGTVQFGLPYGIANQAGQVSRPEARKMLQLAAAKGVDTLDTAIAYGESETCLGEVGCQDFKLVTKLPAVPDRCNDINYWINDQVSSSLGRLGTSSVYGLLLHRSEQLLGLDGEVIFQALKDLKEAGLVQKIGISIYSPDELDELIPRYQFDLVQAPFNLVDRRICKSGWLQRLKQEGVEVHTRSVFLQGLLLMHRSDIPKKFAPWSKLWNDWHDWLERHSVTAVQACLAYPLSFSEVDRVIVGADSVSQLRQIIIAAISAASDDLPDIHCDAESLLNPSEWATL